MTTAVIAEKPSVARDIALVLGAKQRKEGCFSGGGYIVSFALGHLVALCEPHEINPAWKGWRWDVLPMLPKTWPLTVLESTRAQYRVVERILKDPDIDQVVCATDAGREGELIFRYVYEKARCRKPVLRLWISSLTPAAIKKGMATLKSSAHYDNLAAAARGRSQADWLVGMNLSRAYTLKENEVFSVGRVQTPTLAMLAERTRAIQAFVPEDYLEVVATFETPNGAYVGVFYDDKQKTRLPAEGEDAARIAERARTGEARVAALKKEAKRQPPPLLYDLTELQRHANRLFGFSAKKTLQVAQSLYERHKLISYPRTDSRHLSTDTAETLDNIVPVIRAPYEDKLAPGTGERPLNKRFVNDAKVTDHHAIIPTPLSPTGLAPGSDEQKIYDLICRRLLAAWHRDFRTAVTTVTTEITGGAADPSARPDVYRSSGTTVEDEGWRALDPPYRKKKAADTGERYREQTFPADLKEGDRPAVTDVEILKKQTKPPRPYTEATLLTAMETAGKIVEDKALSEAMRDNGLGTPATRAAIIETLLARSYVVRNGKSLTVTEKGMHLIDIVHDHVKSPAMTGQWERRLKAVERGRESLERFLADIETFITQVVGAVARNGGSVRPSVPAAVRIEAVAPPTPASTRDRRAIEIPAEHETPPAYLADVPPPEDDGYAPALRQVGSDGSKTPPFAKGVGRISSNPNLTSMRQSPYPPFSKGDPENATRQSPLDETPGDQPISPNAPAAVSARRVRKEHESLASLLTRAFGFEGFRPHQEAVCRAVTEGENVLLVMPTGAGKSLCYQLPGIARGGTTLVISPLIALMEDQTAALRQAGFVAERIHSGQSRDDSREVCRRYLRGALDFLFIAPERLAVPGFPEMLAKQMPVLIAVDEAHCISHWGHDFRPDYRMLKDRLAPLRDAPIIAMTATATPIVQDDIVRQLDIPGAGRFIHGFRRTNIAVEVVELPERARSEATLKLLGETGRRPAIVYAPTRKKAEALAADLAPAFPTAAYHAGMNPAIRERVQRDFISGGISVIVATIAFGMGIDKPDVRTVVHVALPGSIEGYYQEIGRAGRDGKPSRAVLMYTYADVKTHEFFLDRDYPDASVLARVYDRLTSARQSRERLLAASGLDEDTLATALEKLWIHGGADVTPDEQVSRGSGRWQAPYMEQRRHKEEQLGRMVAYAQSKGCRMLRLVHHFGDQEDSGEPCGQCDICAPDRSKTRVTRSASREEQRHMMALLRELSFGTTVPKGKLFRESFEDLLTRNEFETLVEGLFRSGHLRVKEDAFIKNGRTIAFEKLAITAKGYKALREKGGIVDDIRISEVASKKRKSKKRRTRSKPALQKPAAKQTPSRAASAVPNGPASYRLVSELKAWRLTLARKRGIPAFRILTDRVVNAIAAAPPESEDDLLSLSGVGETIVKKYGKQILSICRRVGA